MCPKQDTQRGCRMGTGRSIELPCTSPTPPPLLPFNRAKGQPCTKLRRGEHINVCVHTVFMQKYMAGLECTDAHRKKNNYPSLSKKFIYTLYMSKRTLQFLDSHTHTHSSIHLQLILDCTADVLIQNNSHCSSPAFLPPPTTISSAHTCMYTHKPSCLHIHTAGVSARVIQIKSISLEVPTQPPPPPLLPPHCSSCPGQPGHTGQYRGAYHPLPQLEGERWRERWDGMK